MTTTDSTVDTDAIRQAVENNPISRAKLLDDENALGNMLLVMSALMEYSFSGGGSATGVEWDDLFDRAHALQLEAYLYLKERLGVE